MVICGMVEPKRTKYSVIAGQLFRWLLLTIIILDLALIALRVLLYTPLLAQSGALVFVFEPVALLLIYASIVLAITSNRGHDRIAALKLGAKIGLITGIMWVVNLALETFADLLGSLSILSTAPFLLGAFVLWSIAGGRIAWQSGALGMGILASIWSAMICVLIAIAFGFVLTYTSLPRLEQILAKDADFLRSHWSDMRAFAIANSFDSAFSHLMGALLVGGIVGTVGSLVGLFAGRQSVQHMAQS